MKPIGVWCALLSVAAIVPASASDQLPQELAQIAFHRVNCQPVPGYFQRPGMVEPPYVYGYLPGDEWKSAAFWCYRCQDKKPYILAFVHEGRLVGTINWGYYPGGLALAKTARMSLHDFAYVDDPETYGPEGEFTQYPPVQDEYDGAPTFFYQYKGKWMYRVTE